MKTVTTQLGGLSCRLVQGGDAPASLVVVLCHGYGAPGTDLVPLAHELAAMDPILAEGVRFVFPEAPISLDSLGLWGGRAWWPIDVGRFERAARTGELAAMLEEVPPELVTARRKLMALVEAVAAQTGLPMGRIVLGGFSQGSMLAVDVTLRLDEPPAQLVILSGAPVALAEWVARAPRRRGLPVFQAHGQGDPLLPFALAELLRDALAEAGLDVDFHPFRGGHTVDRAVLGRLAARLAALK